jgi:hypothetical protein
VTGRSGACTVLKEAMKQLLTDPLLKHRLHENSSQAIEAGKSPASTVVLEHYHLNTKNVSKLHCEPPGHVPSTNGCPSSPLRKPVSDGRGSDPGV